MSLRVKLTDFENYMRNHDTKYVEEFFIFEGKSDVPHPKGLLSPDIFGETFQDRRTKMGAIKLDGYYLHPLIYSRIFKRHWRKLEYLLSGDRYYKLEDGELVEVEEDEGGGTGIEFFYENYDDINMSKFNANDDDSSTLQNLKKVVKMKTKNEMFTNKWLVIPLTFRDINTDNGGHVSLDILNEKYKKLLSMVKIVADSKGNPMFDLHKIRYRIQLTLVDIYDFLQDKAIRGKNSILRRKVMSRNVDYTSRLVISAPEFTSEAFGESPVDLDTCGMPLSAAADSFAPFVINSMYQTLRSMYDNGQMDCELQEFEEKYSHQELHGMIDTYTESWGERFNVLTVPGKEDEFLFIEGEHKVDGKWVDFHRKMTLTDLIYQSTHFAVEVDQKFDIISRYPIMDAHHIFPNKIHVLSTYDTKEVKINDYMFEYYPDIDLIVNDPDLIEDIDEFESKVSSIFNETLNISNLHISGFNGDILSAVFCRKTEYYENVNCWKTLRAC